MTRKQVIAAAALAGIITGASAAMRPAMAADAKAEHKDGKDACKGKDGCKGKNTCECKDNTKAEEGKCKNGCKKEDHK